MINAQSEEEIRRSLAEEHMKKNINRLPNRLREAEVRSYNSEKKLPPLSLEHRVKTPGRNIKIDFIKRSESENETINKKLDLANKDTKGISSRAGRRNGEEEKAEDEDELEKKRIA